MSDNRNPRGGGGGGKTRGNRAGQGSYHKMNRNHQVHFDGTRMREKKIRKTVDYFPSIIRAIQGRIINRNNQKKSKSSLNELQPHITYSRKLLPPSEYLDKPCSSVMSKYVWTSIPTSQNMQNTCPIFSCAWTPDGKRLISGALSGELIMWHGLTFNFVSIFQAHDTAIRELKWSPDGLWMISADDSGVIKYWAPNMNNLKVFHEAHPKTIRSLTFSPNSNKFASGSDDATIKIWDFYGAKEERELIGHGHDVKSVDWHPRKGLLASGSKDNTVKFWDPRQANGCLSTLHIHKNGVNKVTWNKNGNWLLTGSSDNMIRLFDIRTMSEIKSFAEHNTDVCALLWHPIHETLFFSGEYSGTIQYWQVDDDEPLCSLARAHDQQIWSASWHPLGHIICTASNDHSIKFWTRSRPGEIPADIMRPDLAPTLAVNAQPTQGSNFNNMNKMMRSNNMMDNNNRIQHYQTRQDHLQRNNFQNQNGSFNQHRY